MSLKNKEKQTRLLHDINRAENKRWISILLVVSLMLQLVLPVVTYADASTEENDAMEPNVEEVQAEEAQDESIESPMALNNEEEDVETDNKAGKVEEVVEQTPQVPAAKEEPAQEVVEEPAQTPDENTEEEANAPPAPEAPEKPVAPEAPVKPETPKAPVESETPEKPEVSEKKEETEPEETVEEEVAEELSLENGVAGVLDGYSGVPHAMQLFEYSSINNLSKAQFSSFDVGLMSDNGLSPGEVRTTKTATPVPGMVNTWDIEVLIEGMDAQKTSDIVLVIDRSGSMQGNRMTNAINAAKNFVETLIPASGGGNTRIAVVSFSDTATTNSDLDSNRTQKINQINNLSASGGTHTQAAIRRAKEILDGSGQRDYKHIVLLSDGVPTYSYGFNSNTTRNGGLIDSSSTIRYQTGNSNVDTFSNRHYRTGKNYSAGAFSSTTVGNGYAPNNYDEAMHYSSGSNDTYGSWPNNRRVFYDHGNSTINESTFSKNAGYMVWTVALDPSTDGQQIIGEIASPNRAYTASPSDLNAIFAEIAGSINSAARDMVVTDPMGVGFQIPANQISNITVSQGTVNYNQSTKTISWNAGNLNRPSGSNVKSATLKYRVEINDDILTLPGAKTNDHQLFKTNGTTTLNYTDSDSVSKSKEFISPKVDPVLLKVKKILKSPDGNVVTNDSRRFNVNINKPNPNEYNHNANLVPGADYVWLTTLRHEGTYNVSETGITGPGETNLNQFIISYSIDGSSQTSFLVNHTNGIPRGDVTIDVTNQEIRKISITATKVWEGGPAQKPNIQLQLLRNGIAFGNPVTLTSGQTSYTWPGLSEKDPQGNLYTYTVKEIDPPSGYESEMDGLTITNTYIIPRDASASAKKVWLGGDPEDHEAVDLTLWRTINGQNFEEITGVNPIVTPSSNDTVWSYVWANLERTDFNGNEYTFYFTEDDVPEGFTRIYSNPTTVSGVIYEPSGGTVTNQQMTIDFEFEKVNEVGNPLTGAVFKLERIKEDNTRTEIPNVGTDPIFKYEDLIAGSYVLTEISAPENYVTPEDNTWLFHVVWNDTTKQMEINFEIGDEVDGEIANYPKGMLPDTGGPGNTHLIIISMVAFTLFMTLGVWRFKRNEVDTHD